ncbi:D-alanyl-D-alanine carboxypeptidase family protein [uncultured Clostridium sp.]|uniref:D-alanyl-D-alanine carboxypeptidase family protein n=1 Tax=uncultured Clostridium sp. TaxID=59620 RepID=UPI002587696B|nr:serine hydrolase [uncultured Clostridium sp.]MDU1347946.1 serine hydrolase [Clostridium argentinense]
MRKRFIVLIIAIMVIFSSSYNVFAIENPEIAGKYAITVDFDSGEIIYYKDGDNLAFPASITKIMSALLLCENLDMNEKLTFTQEASKEEPTAINGVYTYINVGTEISASDVLKSMMIVSANDMTTTLATNIPKKDDGGKAFVEMMNKRAKELGMNNTNFITPHGLDDYTEKHKTTPYDLTKLTRKAFTIEELLKAVKTSSTELAVGERAPFIVENTNKFVRKGSEFYDKSCIGGKTGYTDKAGRCLLTVFERDGRKIVGVVLNSKLNDEDTVVFEDMKKIIDYSYEISPKLHRYTNSKGEEIELKAGNVIETLPVEYKLFKYFGPKKTIETPIIISKDLTYYDNEPNNKEAKVEFNITGDLFKRKSEENFGTVKLNIRDSSKSSPITTTITSWNIIKANILIYISIIIIIILVIGILITLRKRKQRIKRLQQITKRKK